jgi:hypothetical protein
MFAKILYPTDFSDVALKALQYIEGLKAAGTKQVVLLRVVSDKSMRDNLSSALLGSVSDHVIRHAKCPVIVIKRS